MKTSTANINFDFLFFFHFRISWKKNEVADYEATNFSIFYNNALFLAVVIFLSFYLLKNFTPAVNYILSVSSAAGLIALLTTGTQ